MSTAPTCMTCSTDSRVRLTNGKEIYPHRADLHHKTIWKCDGCSGYVGCHPGGDRALGTPANTQLRRARMDLHNELVDPLWRNAVKTGGYNVRFSDKDARGAIERTARTRVYEFLADKLGIGREQCHIGMFNLEQCRNARSALYGVTYPQIRDWAKAKAEAAA